MTDYQKDHALFDCIRIAYQPIVRLSSRSADYLEVLARTADEAGAWSGPERVVAAMDSAERSLAITAQIMGRALTEYPSFTPEPPCTLAFNLPLDALLHPMLMERIEAGRAAAGIDATHIQFELTETHPVTNPFATGAAIAALRAAGYRLALDDVTPSMHNLAALLRLPIAAFKLDHSVTNATDASTQDFIGRLAARAAADGKIVIAEGIEDEPALRRMRALGVTHGQGFLFAAAMPAGALAGYLGLISESQAP